MSHKFESLKSLTWGSQQPCEGCKVLNCHSIHGTVTRSCHLNDCSSCTDLALTDNEISATYQHLLDLVQKRVHTIKKRHHGAYIHRLPIEILSFIFLFFKEALTRESEEDDFGATWFNVPPQSQLLVGAVCKRWREITLAMPTLWTDIVIDIEKSSYTQIDMINEWAHRAGTLPLNLTMFLHTDDGCGDVLEDYRDVVKTLRSLVLRWNDLALRIPWSSCYNLLRKLKKTPTIRSFFYLPTTKVNEADIFELRTLQRPLCPKYFYCKELSMFIIESLRWDNLHHLQVDRISKGQLLDIVGQAPILRRCVAEKTSDRYQVADAEPPIPTTPITSKSLFHLKTTDSALEHLTLPSLQHLEFRQSRLIPPMGPISPFVAFSHRSSPRLRTLILTLKIWPAEFNPCLEEMVELRCLSITLTSHDALAEVCPSINHVLRTLTNFSNSKIFLPRLKELTLDVPVMPPSSWGLFGRIFKKDIQAHTPDTMFSVTLGRPLTKVHVIVWDEVDVIIDTDTLVRLSWVRKLGVDVDVLNSDEISMFVKKPSLNVDRGISFLYLYGRKLG